MTAGRRTEGRTPRISSPWDPWNRLAGGASTPWDLGPSPTRWGPFSPGTSRAATAAEPFLSGDRAVEGHSASAPEAPDSISTVTST